MAQLPFAISFASRWFKTTTSYNGNSIITDDRIREELVSDPFNKIPVTDNDQTVSLSKGEFKHTTKS